MFDKLNKIALDRYSHDNELLQELSQIQDNINNYTRVMIAKSQLEIFEARNLVKKYETLFFVNSGIDKHAVAKVCRDVDNMYYKLMKRNGCSEEQIEREKKLNSIYYKGIKKLI